MNKQIKIINGRVITPTSIINNGTVLINQNKIEAIAEQDIDAPEAVIIDAAGKYV